MCLSSSESWSSRRKGSSQEKRPSVLAAGLAGVAVLMFVGSSKVLRTPC
jgi:hypothetical protein